MSIASVNGSADCYESEASHRDWKLCLGSRPAPTVTYRYVGLETQLTVADCICPWHTVLDSISESTEMIAKKVEMQNASNLHSFVARVHPYHVGGLLDFRSNLIAKTKGSSKRSEYH